VTPSFHFLYIYSESSYLPKSNLLRQPKTSTEHPLLRRHISDIIHVHILHIGGDHGTQLPANLFANALDLLDVIIALGREAVYMDHGKLLRSVRREEFFDFRGRVSGDIGVETDEGWEEGNGGGGEVHDVVRKESWLDERLEGFGLFVLLWFAARGFGFGVDGYGVLVACQQIRGGLTYKGSAVGVEGTDKVAYFVDLDVSHKRVVGFGVEVVRPDEALLLARGYGKGSYAGHDVADCLALAEHVAEPFVLRVQTRVPVYFCKVEFEGAALLAQLDVHVVRAVEHFVLEGAECVLGAYIVELVDDRLDHGVLVCEDGCDEVLVGPIPFAEV